MRQEAKSTNVHFSETLSELMNERGIKNIEVAKALGLSPTAVGNYVKGRLPRAEELLSLAQYFGVPIERFLGGKKVARDAPTRNERTPREHGGPFWGTTDQAPIISWASAGSGNAFEDQGSDVATIPTPCKDPNCYALEIQGDSMEPLYLSGDIAVVAPNQLASNNDLVIAKLLDDSVFFKRLQITQGGKLYRLLSINPHHHAIDLKRTDLRFIHPVYSVTRFFKKR